LRSSQEPHLGDPGLMCGAERVLAELHVKRIGLLQRRERRRQVAVRHSIAASSSHPHPCRMLRIAANADVERRAGDGPRRSVPRVAPLHSGRLDKPCRYAPRPRSSILSSSAAISPPASAVDQRRHHERERPREQAIIARVLRMLGGQLQLSGGGVARLASQSRLNAIMCALASPRSSPTAANWSSRAGSRDSIVCVASRGRV